MSKDIFGMDLQKIQSEIANNQISVCVVGIGRIGLPTALSFAKSGLKTIGVDINENLVSMINQKKFPLKDEPGYEEIFSKVINDGSFSATTKIEEGVSGSDVILLSLPTPMDRQNTPDYTALRTVGKQLCELMSPGTILIVESTIEPGFIENEFVKIVNNNLKLEAGKNFGLGVCPETANPGEIMKDFENLPRLVGATDDKTAKIITEVYKHVFPVELINMPDCKTANAVKLTTNVFRDINIAFVNELAMLFEKLGIDIFTVLDAADKKYNFQVHYPGAGVGGPCLPVNSYQMLSSAKIQDDLLKIVKVARDVNESMPFHVIELMQDALREAEKKVKSSKILILGISYKPNVKDIQLSPAETIVSKLKELGAEVRIFDPYFKSVSIYGIQTDDNMEKSLAEVDAVILVTAHKEFLGLDPEYFAMKMKTPILVDCRGIINAYAAKKAGLVFRGLGRGKI